MVTLKITLFHEVIFHFPRAIKIFPILSTEVQCINIHSLPNKIQAPINNKEITLFPKLSNLIFLPLLMDLLFRFHFQFSDLYIWKFFLLREKLAHLLYRFDLARGLGGIEETRKITSPQEVECSWINLYRNRFLFCFD